MEKLEWEVIENKAFGWTERAKVFGGWIIKCSAMSSSIQYEGQQAPITPAIAISTTFISDPEHLWVLESNLNPPPPGLN